MRYSAGISRLSVLGELRTKYKNIGKPLQDGGAAPCLPLPGPVGGPDCGYDGEFVARGLRLVRDIG